MKRMAHVPEPEPELGWTLVFGSILAAIIATLLVACVFVVAQP